MEDAKKNTLDSIDEFINGSKKKLPDTIECKDDVCVIKNDKSLIEVLGKRIITDDGRQLLI